MFPVILKMKRLLTGTRTAKWAMASAAAIALASPGLALASGNDRDGRFDRNPPAYREVDHREIDRHYDDHRGPGPRVDIDIHVGQRPPEYRTREVQVWVPAVYQTQTEQVWIADQFQDQEVRFRDHGRPATRIDRVLVVPGHYETRDRQVCVSEGHYETRIERVSVTRGIDPVNVITPILGGIGIHAGQ